MKKVVLVDGNNLMFRSYFATLYSGSTLRNKKGFPTNAIYGFVNMINKIISEEKPMYMAVAFDIGKTFRHEKYDYYKGKRDNTPDELKEQFPIAKQILTAMNIKYFELQGYEADDIIGTFSKKCEQDDDFKALIVSSDKDLLQLITDQTEVKLLKTKDYIRMDYKAFYDTYGIEPIKMIDLKALMGDASDNIPGVKGIGEKTALKLLTTYGSLSSIYEHIDEIKGSVKDKLIQDKDNAYMSYNIATIYKDVPLNVELEELAYIPKDKNELYKIYNELEFYSLIKESNNKEENSNNIENINYINKSKQEINDDIISLYIDLDNNNYHNANILGFAIYNNSVSSYIPYTKDTDLSFLNKKIYTYDYKRLYVSLKKNNLTIPTCLFDTMIGAYLVNYNIKDDISYLAKQMGYEIDNSSKENSEIDKAKFVYDTYNTLMDMMQKENVMTLYNDIEFPLVTVLAKMEMNGIKVKKEVLFEMKDEILKRIEEVSQIIYNMAGVEFNISSPKQLGDILFEKLGLPHAKKNKTGYSTDISVLEKLRDYPIVEYIIEYRTLYKLYTTYIEGILNSISSDGKIHTIYTQTVARTGRLSSIEPNLQNIPIRYELGRLIRKAFVPLDNSILMSCDYSQIELRVFAHLSKVPELVMAFVNDMDIHTKTAMDIFRVKEEEVTKDMRRKAKAVNFGILYGISSYGLSEDLNIKPKEAKEFINKYFETYPGVKEYMDKEIEEAKKNGYVKTIMNRKRIIEELHSTNHVVRSMGERMALNTPIQGSSADILKMAMIKIDKYFEDNNIKSTMLLQVHDELIFNVIKEEEEEVRKIVSNIMENIIKLDVPLKVSIEEGNNWYEAK
ncbi:dNA polymerase [Clostridium sp. CAG:914]|jgi:DNA polymerase-1|nr:dNA polymerase [Clostridium sp. CAG:914]